ncbi:MAG: sigma-70 family RNA polymerase sigma factor [Bacteroidota bacterium]
MLFRKKLHIKDLSDEALVTRYKDHGESACLGELYERYMHVVFLVCMKYVKDESTSEDLAMQIFEKLMVDLRKYEIKTFKYWLHSVVRNHCLIYLDKEKKRRVKRERLQQDLMAKGEDRVVDFGLEVQMDKELQLQQMEQALTKLKLEQRVCVELFFLQKKSYQEVASETGYTLKQVKSYIQNGKRNLKIRMEQMSVEDSYHE